MQLREAVMHDPEPGLRRRDVPAHYPKERSGRPCIRLNIFEIVFYSTANSTFQPILIP